MTTKTKTAYVEIRSQKSKGKWPGGPDTYVAVQIVPNGAIPLQNLNRSAAERRGIEIKYFGEGYGNRQKTDRSMLRRAILAAENFAENYNIRKNT